MAPALTISEHSPFSMVNRFLPSTEPRSELLQVLHDGITNEMAGQPGFIAAAIHSSQDSDDVLVYAQWESGDALAAAGQIVQNGGAPNMARGFDLGRPQSPLHNHQRHRRMTRAKAAARIATSNGSAGPPWRRALWLLLGAATAIGIVFATPANAQQEPSRWADLIERDWADLPAAAQDTPIPQDKGYLTREIKPGVFVVTDGLYQAMFVVGRRGIVVVDAPTSLGTRLSDAIRETTPKPVTHFIYSHSHIDHVGAAAQFENVVRIASADVAAKLARLRDPARPRATRILSRSITRMTIDGTPFRFDTHGTQHEPGNLYIHLPSKRVLMAVDLVFPGWVPFTNLGMAEDVQGFIDAHPTILRYDFDVFVGGHLSRPGTRADVETQQAYIADLVAAAQEGHRTTFFADIAATTGFANRWLLVKTYMDSVADKCASTMLAKWHGKLGGAAVSTPGHCWVMQEHLAINGLPMDL